VVTGEEAVVKGSPLARHGLGTKVLHQSSYNHVPGTLGGSRGIVKRKETSFLGEKQLLLRQSNVPWKEAIPS